MWTTRIISSLAAAGIAFGAAAPAMAYITTTVDEKPTRRDIRQDREQNSPEPMVGDILVFGGERGEAQVDMTGRNYLPIRGIVRDASRRNAHHHKLGAQRGGQYQTLGFVNQGDERRTPRAEGNGLEQLSPLPPRLVQTGGNEDTRPTRRAIRGDREFNDLNRR